MKLTSRARRERRKWRRLLTRGRLSNIPIGLIALTPFEIPVWHCRCRMIPKGRQRPAVTDSQGPLRADAGPELSDDGAKGYGPIARSAVGWSA